MSIIKFNTCEDYAFIHNVYNIVIDNDCDEI